MKKIGEKFLSLLKNELLTLGIDLDGMVVDHLCYRVKTEEEYFIKKAQLSRQGVLLTEAFVNGRPIATFRLSEPFVVDGHEIKLVELPFPKKGTSYETGFEHAEVILQESFESFKNRFPHLSFSQGGHPNVNPEYALRTKHGSLKLHYVPLDRVIEIENSEVTDVIFDLDGTIINSRETIFKINQLVFSRILKRQVTIEEAKEKFHSEFDKLLHAFEITCPQLKSAAIAHWAEVAGGFEYELFEGMVDLLNTLKANGLNLHLWTARDEVSARKILLDHCLIHLFSSLSFSNSENSKPEPDNLKMPFKDKPLNSYVVIGDSAADIRGALNINAIAAGALWDKYSCHHSLIKSGAELCFFNVSEFREWLATRPKVTLIESKILR